MDLHAWLLGATGALVVGISKSGVPGLGTLAIPLLAMVFPARLSVGALLPMLIAGDIFAIVHYHRHARWRSLWGLFPFVFLGMGLAALVLARITDEALRPLLGLLVLAMILLDQFRQRMGWHHLPRHPAFIGMTGTTAGFATTVGNAAGPIMSVYFLSHDLPKENFMGTQAWYFFLVNTAKVPLYAALGMITRESLRFNLWMLPIIAVGAWIGIRILPRIPQQIFKTIVLSLAALAALRLLLP